MRDFIGTINLNYNYMIFNSLNKTLAPYAAPACEMFEMEGQFSVLAGSSAQSSIDDWVYDPEVINL